MTGEQGVLPFQKRFNINIPVEQARERFVNRVSNLVVKGFLVKNVEKYQLPKILTEVATGLGERINDKYPAIYAPDTFEDYTQNDYFNTLKALEVLHNSDKLTDSQKTQLLTILSLIIDQSEIELALKWEEGAFVPSGAKFLDDKLVIENLQWLADLKYQSVLVNFREGLSHFLEAKQNSQRLSDVIEDMYKALESIAKAVTCKDYDLSKNRELFVKKLGVSEYYQKMLYLYIDYANDLSRHGAEPTTKHAIPSPNETEAFVYLTGLFIRFSIMEIKSKKSHDKGAL